MFSRISVTNTVILYQFRQQISRSSGTEADPAWKICNTMCRDGMPDLSQLTLSAPDVLNSQELNA
jgi:hypothetical protein